MKPSIPAKHLEVFKEAQQVMIPVHTNEPRHWFLAHVNVPASRIELYDSSRTSDADRYLPICERVAKILAVLDGKPNDFAKLDIRSVECAQQPDGSVDCGSYITFFAKHLACGIRPSSDKFSILSSQSMREIMYWELRFSRILMQDLNDHSPRTTAVR